MFDKILFLIFVLPAVMIKDLWERFTEGMTKKEKKELLWKIPYVLIFIIIIIMIILWNAGYR